MRIMARSAPFRSDWRVFIDKRACLFGMALYADGVPSDTASQFVLLECAMRIVTIAAIHQPFIHLVMERLRKSGLDVSVAGIAELRL